MISRVPYHITEGATYTLIYATCDESLFKEKCSQLGEETPYLTRTYTFDEKVYCIYTQTRPSENKLQCDFSLENIEDLDLETDDSNTVLKYAILSLFNSIEMKNDDFVCEKKPEFDNIQSIFNQINWKKSIPEVTSQILSTIILSHPFPNGNHRTALSFTLLYLDTTIEEFEPEELPNNFNEFANTYITTSKQILTVRRKTTPLKILQSAGCKSIVRKNGTEISLDEFELSVSDPHTFYANGHYRLSQTFIETLLNEMGLGKYLLEKDKGKAVFEQALLNED